MEERVTMLNEEQPGRPDYVLTKEIRGYLRETAKWGTFISILIIVGAAFMVLGGLMMSVFGIAGLGSEFSQEFSQGMPEDFEGEFGGIFGGLAVFASFIYILVGAFNFLPGYYLFQFSSKIKLAFRSRNEVALAAAFRNLKSNFKFVGLGIIIGIVLYILFFVFMFIGLAMSGIAD